MKFKDNEEKLKHIGLMCCTNLHDAFANMSNIISLCSDKNIPDKEKLKLIKEKADATYELFRVIERYRNQTEKSTTKTFSSTSLAESIGKAFKYEGLKVIINSDFEITCKKPLLLQSLINLIDNAYTHNSNEYGKREVILTINHNEIIVSDNGNGIPDENKNKIFDLFFTTKNLDRLHGNNNGVGLFGVKQHIDSLGYTIEVKNNTILKGANFTIKLK